MFIVNWWYTLFETLYNWFLSFASGMQDIWEWLTTPLTIKSAGERLWDIITLPFRLTDINVTPLFAIIGTVALIGLLRRIF